MSDPKADRLEYQIAEALDTEPALLPLLPDLLADLQELGTSSAEIVECLRRAGLARGSRVLDLGCGKGAVALALAAEMGLRVDGIDGFEPFLASAREAAAEAGLGTLCDFQPGDLLDFLGQDRDYDAVLLLNVGPVAGDYQSTMEGLRTLVRRGGLIVLEDGYLADGVPSLPDWPGYGDLATTRRSLAAFGDEWVDELIYSVEEIRAVNERNTELIRRRAELVKRDQPQLAPRIDEYVANQEEETEILGRDLICALWVLRRAA
ncbi:MAG: class I SAM-dependent methyltransferase [Thermoanaerobaculia bacterium]|nr:class I SAM-dependent methyltransferase [Thermoanaerobaculia bacterium]